MLRSTVPQLEVPRDPFAVSVKHFSGLVLRRSHYQKLGTIRGRGRGRACALEREDGIEERERERGRTAIVWGDKRKRMKGKGCEWIWPDFPFFLFRLYC